MYYPDIKDKAFARRLFSKTEFAELAHGNSVYQRLLGLRMHQAFVTRFISPCTPYTHLMLVHVTGSGKTWSMASVIDSFKHSMGKAVVLLQGETAESAFKSNMLEWYERYYGVESSEEKLDKYMRKYIDIRKYIKFSKGIKSMSDEEVKNTYSGRLILIDEVHRLNIKGSASDNPNKSTYEQISRMLALVTDVRVIVSTATPIVDIYQEIFSLVNLLLPVNERLITPQSQTLNNLRKSVRGRISYFMEELGEKPRVIEMGSEVSKSKQRFVFVRMRGHQLAAYKLLPNTSAQMYMAQKYCSLSVLPVFVGTGELDAVTDKAEIPSNYFEKVPSHDGGVSHVRFSDARVREMVRRMWGSRSASNRSRDGLYAYSCKLTYMLEEMTKPERRKEKCFAFCREVQAFGIKALSAFLNAIGFSFYDGSQDISSLSKGLRFTLITGEDSGTPRRGRAHALRLRAFNDPSNKYGEKIKLLMVSDVGGESLTLKCVRQVHVLTPFWNNNKTLQVIARAVRMGSHKDLEESERYVQVYKYIALADPETSAKMWTVNDAYDDIPLVVVDFDKEFVEERNIDFKEQVRANQKSQLSQVVDGILKSESIDRLLHLPVVLSTNRFATRKQTVLRGNRSRAGARAKAAGTRTEAEAAEVARAEAAEAVAATGATTGAEAAEAEAAEVAAAGAEAVAAEAEAVAATGAVATGAVAATGAEAAEAAAAVAAEAVAAEVATRVAARTRPRAVRRGVNLVLGEDRSTVALARMSIPIEPLINHLISKLMVDGYVTIDSYCSEIGIDKRSLDHVKKFLILKPISIVGKNGVLSCINVNCNVIHLEAVLGKRDCSIWPRLKHKEQPSEWECMTVGGSLDQALSRIDGYDTQREIMVAVTELLGSRKCNVVELVERSLSMCLPKLKHFLRSAWIEAHGELYHMARQTMIASTSYNRSSDMSAYQILPHIRVFYTHSKRWRNIGDNVPEAAELAVALASNHNRVRDEAKMNRTICAYYTLSDLALRVRDTSMDDNPNKRLKKRGRVVRNYNDEKEVKEVALKLVLEDLSIYDLIEVHSSIGDVVITEEVITKNKIHVASDSGTLSGEDAIHKLMLYPHHLAVMVAILEMGRAKVIAFTEKLCYDYHLYSVVV